MKECRPAKAFRSFSCALASHCISMFPGQVWANDCKILDELNSYSAVPSAPKDAICAVYRGQEGSTGVSCHWEFAFRSSAARAFADTVWAQIQTCSVGKTSEPEKQVNHPDSYVLREWITDDRVFWVSVKDKGALNQTLVFVRYEERS